MIYNDYIQIGMTDKKSRLFLLFQISYRNKKTKKERKMSEIHSVVVHPIVLLGITDHVKRMSKISKGRVVGVLLGSCRNGVVDCTTSFASMTVYLFLLISPF